MFIKLSIVNADHTNVYILLVRVFDWHVSNLLQFVKFNFEQYTI